MNWLRSCHKEAQFDCTSTMSSVRDGEADSPPPSYSAASTSVQGLWHEAAVSIKWKCPNGLDIDTTDTMGLLNSLHEEALQRTNKVQAKQHKWRRRNGKDVTFRDIWGKVLEWVKKFQTIGDIAIQADAGYASLPWVMRTSSD